MLKKPEKIIIIDDEPEYAEKLKTNAKAHRLLATCFDNLDMGMRHLQNNPSVRFVVLDDNCFIDSSRSQDARTSFVVKAIQEIEEINFEQNREIPFCINAYEPDKLADWFAGTAKVFAKKDAHSEQNMWQHIAKSIEEMPQVQQRIIYETPFAFIDKHLTEAEELLLHSILDKMDKTDEVSVVTTLSLIRRLEEVVFEKGYQKANDQAGAALPLRDNTGRGRTKNIMQALQDNGFIPQYIRSMAFGVYSNCSKFGNHNFKNRDALAPILSPYLTKSMVYSLFTVMEYFHENI